MNRISKGQIYNVERTFSGQSSRGPYELVVVREGEKKKNTEINIWVTNTPSGVSKGDRFRIAEITEVSYRWKKDKVWNPSKRCEEEGWQPSVDVNASIARIPSDLDGIDVPGNPDFDGLDNPFDNDALIEAGELPL